MRRKNWKTGQKNMRLFLCAIVLSLQSSMLFGIPAAFAATNHVVINEILAHPASGEVEAIELYNPTDQPVNLSGWRINLGGSTNFSGVFASGTTISAHGFLVRSGGSITLNNTSATVNLQSGSGSPSVDTVTYSQIVQGKSYARSHDGAPTWSPQAEPTIGTTNGSLALSAPVVLTPAPDSVTNASAQSFEWETVDGAARYRFQLATDTSFAAPVVDETIEASHFEATLADGEYFWRVSAVAPNGTTGVWSGTRSLAVDRKVPTIAISPVTEVVRGTVVVTATMNDAHASTVAIETTGCGAEAARSSGSTATVTIDTTTAPDGVDTCRIKATGSDTAGNPAHAAETAFSVDNHGPTITFSLSDSPITNSTNILGSLDDMTGVASYEISVINGTGTILGSYTRTGGSAISVPWSDLKLPNGQYDVKVEAIDTIGNRSSKSFTVSLANPLPATTINIASSSPTATNDAAITISGRTNPGNKITLFTANGEFVGTPTVEADGTWSYVLPAGVKAGVYEFFAVATDGLNESATDVVSLTILPFAPVGSNALSTNLSPPTTLAAIRPLAVAPKVPAPSERSPAIDTTPAPDSAQAANFAAGIDTNTPIAASSSGWKIFGVAWYWWGGAATIAAGAWWLWQRQRAGRALTTDLPPRRKS